MKYSDADLLRLVSDEKKRSVGFDINSELLSERNKALEYLKGEMTDLPLLPNRSTAVSTDVADAVETWLSDMVEILAGGEDVVSFSPNGPEDEDAARQETDYVNHVFFNENPGFMTLYTMLKDAGETKTGLLTWWEEDVPAPEPKAYSGLTEAQLGMLLSPLSDSVVENIRPSEQTGMEPLFDCEVSQKPRRRVRVDAVNPTDFTVASDTKRLKDTTYCAQRQRPRAQDLIADGVDPDTVDRLPAYTGVNQTEELARDTVGEHETGPSNGATGDLRQVEIIKHYIRLVDDDRSTKIWCVRTSNDEAILIDYDECDEIPYAAITPYPVTHRFYGLSIADKAMEPQKVRTVLTRATLDSAHFALNQRAEVSEEQSTENTIPDLLRNEPLMPVRSKTGTAIRPLQSPGLGFDPFNALEYFATVVEQRTGIVRNAQGLNPDTLHDTAAGANMLVTAAQKRTRLMARIFAETGIKDAYLAIHALLRRIGGFTPTIRLRGQWVDVDPTSWGERTDMTVEVGVGASGRLQDLAAMGAVIGKQAEAVNAQGGSLNGPLVNASNLYAAAIRFTQKAGLKNPELFWSDPSNFQPQPPPPDPKAIAAAQGAQNDAARVQVDQGKLSIEEQRAQTQAQHDALRIALDERKLAIDEAKVEMERDSRERAHAIELARIEAEARAHSDKLAADTAIRLADINAKYQTSVTVAQIKSSAEQFRAGADVLMQAADHAHDHAMEVHRHENAAEQAEAAMTDARDDAEDIEDRTEEGDGRAAE